MRVTEPMTMLTDYLLGALCFVLAVRLFRQARAERQATQRLWAAALVATGGAALVGGTYHGFTLHLTAFTLAALWKTTLYLVGLASLFMLSGTILATVASPLRRWLLVVVLAKFLVYAAWMVTRDDFRYVVYDYVPAMLAVLGLMIWAAWRRRESGARWVIAGVLVSFAAAGIQQSGFALAENFNHNDLYHVIQMLGVYLLYQGARRLRDFQPAA